MVMVQRSGPEQGNLEPSVKQEERSVRVWEFHHVVLCVLMNVHAFFVHLLLHCGRALPLALYTGCASTEPGTPVSCWPQSQLVVLPAIGNLALLVLPFPCGDHVCLSTRKAADTSRLLQMEYDIRNNSKSFSCMNLEVHFFLNIFSIFNFIYRMYSFLSLET